MMYNDRTIALLQEVLAFLNSQPRFRMKTKRRQHRYQLALRIDAHLATLVSASHSAIGEARRRWALSSFIRVDPDEREFEAALDGYWVRGWIKIGLAVTGGADPRLRERYEEAVAKLPLMNREAFDASRLEGLDHGAIAERLGLTRHTVEHLIAEALVSIARDLQSTS